MWDIIILVCGFVMLMVGANLFVTGASSIALRLKISNLVIGMTVVAFGTSAPELFISSTASLKHNSAIALGNVLGSNIANILLILGLSAMMRRLVFQSNTTLKELPIAILSSIILWLMANDGWRYPAQVSYISRLDGLILLTMFGFFLYYIFRLAKIQPQVQAVETPIMSWSKSIGFAVFGLAGLGFGGNWIVEGAVQIAMNLHLSESLVGLTIVAIGTSLPELATTLTATYKQNLDIAIGNIVGSNIFNILLILGVSASIHPIPIPAGQQIDFLVNIISGVLMLGLVFWGTKHAMERWQGYLLFFLYFGYITFKIMTDQPAT